MTTKKLGAFRTKIGHPCQITSTLVLVTLILNANCVLATCPVNEYRNGIECCPECPSGHRVSEDCSERKITTCKPCSEGTFHNGFNRRKECDPCTKCRPGLGLKVKKPCTNTLDAQCELLDGYFCKEPKRDGCVAAQRHKDCSPGQFIGQKGTPSKDTLCLNCTDGSYSGGNLTSCLPHTVCESVELEQIEPGTKSTDSVCVKHSYTAWIASSPALVPVLVIVVFIVVVLKKVCKGQRKSQKQGSEDKRESIGSQITYEEEMFPEGVVTNDHGHNNEFKVHSILKASMNTPV